jgi:diadenosine tetraphosphate (Ap4A) HIT family hydrolase
MNSPFNTANTFAQAFSDGLKNMLAQHEGLGVYILVLANAAYEPALWEALRPALQQRHLRHAESIRSALLAGQRLSEPEDDLLVFLKLHTMGFDAVTTTRWREAAPWKIQFNPIRALRPPRLSGTRPQEKPTSLLRPFDAQSFHFNKPFLAKEILWEGQIADKTARLLYNKFPFAPLHGLLVPEPQRTLPQYLTPELHGWAWQVVEALGTKMPGFALAFNSLGAQASVNHLHFQSFVQHTNEKLQDTALLPVLSPRFLHNGGSEPYPVTCTVATSATDAWLHIDALHDSATPYNLIYSPGRVHILPRQAQGVGATPAWSAGFGWCELAGIMTVFSHEDYVALTSADIAAALSGLSV